MKLLTNGNAINKAVFQRPKHFVQTTTESGKIGNDKCYSNTSAKLHLDNLENLFASYISKMHLCDTRNLEDLYDRLLSYIELVLKTKHDLNFLNI